MDLSNFTILYVENVERSLAFYRPLLDLEPVEVMDGFALFVSESGTKFGLWSKGDVLPKINDATTRAMELAFTVPNIITLQINYIKWRELGVEIIQEQTELDFGTTFMGLDPDGHRLRVYCSEKA
jgi:predicted enzyme related to lactoylglutathione lyase